MFISIYSYSLSSLPSCEYLVCFQQNNLLFAASIVVFISRSPSLISFVSSCLTSYCLAKYFLNYSISILFCLRSWLFFFLRYLLQSCFFFSFQIYDSMLGHEFHLFCGIIFLVNLFQLWLFVSLVSLFHV